MRIWLCSLLLPLSATATLAGQGSVCNASGIVLDSNGRPIDAACVLAAKRDGWLTQQVLEHPTARTMKDGTFLCPVKEGEDVVIAAPGKSALLVFNSRSGVPVELGPLVLSEGHALTGRVVGPDGRPIVGVTVTVQDWIGTEYPVTKTSRALTDEAGEFSARCVPARQLALVLEKQGYSTRRIGPVSVAARVQAQMIPGAPPTPPERSAGSDRERPPVTCELIGRVLDPAGTPLVGAKVWPSDHELREFRGWVPGETVTTDVEGKFRLTTLPTRKSWLYAWHPDYTLSPATRIDLDVEPIPKAIEIRLSLGESMVGRFHGRIGLGWHVRARDISTPGAADPRTNPPAFVPIKAEGSFRIPRLTEGTFSIVVVIPSFDEIGDPIERWVTTVNLPQEENELVIDADEHRPGFVEGTVRLSKPESWRRLVVLAQEQPPPVHIGSWFGPNPRCGALDAEGRFRLGMSPGYYEFSVADPLTGIRLHKWAGTVQVRPDDSIEREVNLTLTEVPLVITPPKDTPAWFRGFRMGNNVRSDPEFWNDATNQPRFATALFGSSGTFQLEGYWHEATGPLHAVSESIEFDSSDPRPVHVQLKRNQR